MLEFYGCDFYGFPSCYKDRNLKQPRSNLTASEAHARTMDRQGKLEDAGYRFRVIWECDLKIQMRMNPDMKQFFDKVEVHEPLDPRHAFFGGRTNCRKMYHRYVLLVFQLYYTVLQLNA